MRLERDGIMEKFKNKKTLYISLGSLCALIILVLIIVLSVKSCNKKDSNGDDNNPVTAHTHTYDTAWDYDDTKHWHKSTCGHDVKSSESEHTLVDGQCSVCGYKTATVGVKYTLSSDGNSYVASGTEDGVTLSGEVVLARSYNGKPVTAIEQMAFYEYSDITSVTIPNTITTIGTGAFASCPKLESINIPDSVTTIGGMVFYECPSLTSVTIPNSVTSIGVGLFEDCTKLASVTLGEDITSINTDMFYNCTSLKNVVIPNGVTSIGESAFYKCSSLTSIIIPNSVTSIEKEAFDGCTSLANVTVSNNLVSIGVDAFKDCTSLVYNDYDNARYIGNTENPYLVLMTAKSTDITSCTIKETCKFIIDSAFKKCESLTSVTVSDSLLSIGTFAFYSCKQLTSLSIPNSISNIGNNAFYGCSALNYTSYDNGCYLGNTENPYLVYLKTNNPTITTFTINEKCKFICSRAFEDSYITSITIPDNVVSMGSYAFIRCNKLTNVVLSNNMPIIEEDLFYMCSSLTTIVIPDNIETMKNYVFDYCTALTSIYYEGSAENWAKITYGYNHDAIENVTKYYYSETNPTDTTNKYWHYVDKVPTLW